ncbi:MAG: hypothetical protein ACJ74O_03005 [Frankiaceae bacterium]
MPIAVARRATLTALAALAVLLAGAAAPALATARAAAALGPVTTVVAPGCTYDQDYAQAWVDGAGQVHGFFSVDGNESFSCASPSTWRFDGRDPAWTAVKAPIAAHVMSVTGDSTGVYLLYAATDGIHLRKRWPHGAVTDRRLSARGLGTHIVPTGDVVARSGGWWAVWTENSHPSGFGQTDLYQARTIGADLSRTRLTTSTEWSDADPQLALRPGGGAVLVWDRQPVAESTIAQVMKGTTSGGPWHVAGFTGTSGLSWLPDVAVTATSTAITWTHDGTVRYSDDAGGAWHPRTLGSGDAPRIARSAGRTFVAYDDHGYVRLATRGTGGTWATTTVTPLQGRYVHAVTAYQGRATVLYTDFRRLLARTQS